MKLSSSVCTVALASFASAKWNGKPPPEPTAFATQVVNAVQEAAVTQAPEATAAGGSNPFAGAKIYANNYYSSEVVSLAIPSLANPALAAKASKIAETDTFFWM
jgi:cellulose 1,4-beta-cellobiosidase